VQFRLFAAQSIKPDPCGLFAEKRFGVELERAVGAKPAREDGICALFKRNTDNYDSAEGQDRKEHSAIVRESSFESRAVSLRSGPDEGRWMPFVFFC